MRSLLACTVWAYCAGAVVPVRAMSQTPTVGVIPWILSDTSDQRLASALRDALVPAEPHVRVSTKRDLEGTLITEGPDTLSWLELRELGKLMRLDVVVGVHACAGETPCVRIVAGRMGWPSSPDALTFRGSQWIRAATDTLVRRFFPKAPGS
jgi:hypothetical protein